MINPLWKPSVCVFISKWTTLIVLNTTPQPFAGQHRSSTTLHYTVALSLQTELKEETSLKMSFRSKKNTQNHRKLKYEISLQQTWN